MSTPSDNGWVDSYNGIENPQQYGIDGGGNTMSQPMQGSAMGGSPLAGLQQALNMFNRQPGLNMPSADSYGNQSLDVTPNSDFISPASTDLSF